jgi:hypothetical protein
MIEKRGRGQPKFAPTQDQRNQVKLMKALGIPEDRIYKTITNLRTKKPVAPMARTFAPELESGATEVHAMTAPLDPETKRLRRLSPGALADEALALKERIDAIKDEAIRRRPARTTAPSASCSLRSSISPKPSLLPASPAQCRPIGG